MQHRGRYCVYIVRCADGTYYTGSTNDVGGRLKLHNAGCGAKYVRGRRPVTLVYTKACRSRRAALQAEWRLKQLTRRQKAALIANSASAGSGRLQKIGMKPRA